MKNLSIISVVLFCLFSFTDVKSANIYKIKYDSLSCLQLEGKITNEDDEMFDEEYVVELICLSDVVETIKLKEGKKKFKFVLNKNSYYALRISKNGYLSKLVSIDTEMLTESFGIYRFSFEISLIKEAAAKRMNTDVLDMPVAIVQFDYEMNCFSYNKEYSTFIKRELYNVKPSKTQKEIKQTLPQLTAEVMDASSKQ